MRGNSAFETGLAGLVILVAVGFFAFMRLETGIGSLTAYEMTVALSRTDGLKIGDDVRVAGVKIGTVTDLTINPKTYVISARVRIRSDVRIPSDSLMWAAADPVGGTTNLTIKPGHSNQMIPESGSLQRVSQAENFGRSWPTILRALDREQRRRPLSVREQDAEIGI